MSDILRNLNSCIKGSTAYTAAGDKLLIYLLIINLTNMTYLKRKTVRVVRKKTFFFVRRALSVLHYTLHLRNINIVRKFASADFYKWSKLQCKQFIHAHMQIYYIYRLAVVIIMNKCMNECHQCNIWCRFLHNLQVLWVYGKWKRFRFFTSF